MPNDPLLLLSLIYFIALLLVYTYLSLKVSRILGRIEDRLDEIIELSKPKRAYRKKSEVE
jgi:hypothetical protein